MKFGRLRWSGCHSTFNELVYPRSAMVNMYSETHNINKCAVHIDPPCRFRWAAVGIHRPWQPSLWNIRFCQHTMPTYVYCTGILWHNICAHLFFRGPAPAVTIWDLTMLISPRYVPYIPRRRHQEIGEGKIIHYNHRRGLTLDDNPR